MDIRKRIQSLVKTKVKSGADQDVSADNFADEPAVLKSKDHLHEVQHDPRIDQEVINKISKDYFELDDFAVVHAELSRLPTTEPITLSRIEDDRNRLRRQLRAVSKRVSDLILENEALYSTELQRVMDLQQTLKQALCVCSEGRRKMTTAREQFTTSSLKLLADYRKRQQLASLMHSLRTIKTLQRTDVRLREMMEKEDYAGAIELCLECQKAASIFSHYKCISELSSKLQDTLDAIEEQLDHALARTCVRFNETQYERVHAAYALLGKTQTAMDQLHMHFTSAVHNTAFTIVLGYVELCAGVGDSGFHKKQYGELVKVVESLTWQHVQPQTFTPCLTDLCKALWNVMVNYYQTMQWHSAFDTISVTAAADDDHEDDAGDSSLSVEESFTRKYVKQKLEQGQLRLWQEIQLKVRTFFLASDLSHFKFDEFIHILNVINRLMELGEEFSKGKSEVLQEAIKQQTSSYFRHYHRSSMEELRMFLENEGWELCPVKPNFIATQLQEFAFMRTQERQLQAKGRALVVIGAPAQSGSTDLAKQQKSDRFLNFINGTAAPFDLLSDDEDEREDVFTTNGDKASDDDSDSDKDIPDELKVDFVDENLGDSRVQQHTLKHSRRQTNAKRHGVGSASTGDGAIQPMLTNTALTVLRLFGKYIRMMTMLTPIAFNVILSMSQLFDYYFYSVYMNFAALQMQSDGAEKGASGKLQATLARIRNGLTQDVVSSNAAASSTLSGPTALAATDETSSSSASANEKFAMPRLSHAAASHGGKLFGLLERIVGVESLVYLGRQFEFLLPHLESIIPPSKKVFLQQFQSQTIATAAELRHPAYKAVTDRVLSQDRIVGQIAGSKWDIRDIMSQHSDYVDGILRDFVAFSSQLQAFGSRIPISKDVTMVLWEQCSRAASHVFVDGYACVKHCTNEGRALMQLDYQQFVVKFEKMTDLRPLPGREFVEAYIKAYYLPDVQLEAWIKEHKEYNNKHLSSLVSCVAHLNKKAKARLHALIEELGGSGGGGSAAGSSLSAAGSASAAASPSAPPSSRKDPFQQLAALSGRKSVAS